MLAYCGAHASLLGRGILQKSSYASTVCNSVPFSDAYMHRQPSMHDDAIKWKHFSRHWPLVRGIHWSSVNSTYKGQWCWTLMVFLISASINTWVNNCEAGDLRRHWNHYDVIVVVLSDGGYNHIPHNSVGSCYIRMRYHAIIILWRTRLANVYPFSDNVLSIIYRNNDQFKCN